MGDLNDDSNNGTWPVMYGDKPSSNGQCHDIYSPRTIADAYFGYHTEAVKQKILEHEAIFRTQLYELHRLYKVQIDLMDELKMNELQKQSMATETSISSCSASQRQDAQRWHTASVFPPSSSASAKPAIAGEKDFNYTPSFLSKSLPNGLVSASNAGGSKDCDVEILECRPSKARRKFNLELRADEYIDVEEPNFNSKRPPVVSSYPSNGICDDPPSMLAEEPMPTFAFSWLNDNNTFTAGDTATIKVKVFADNLQVFAKSPLNLTLTVNGNAGNSTYISGVYSSFVGDSES